MSQCNTLIEESLPEGKRLISFDTEQDIQFLKWRRNTELDDTHYKMIDLQCGWDPDYATGTYYCWNIWQLSDDAVQQYFYAKHTDTRLDWEQLTLDLDYTLCNWRSTVRFP